MMNRVAVQSELFVELSDEQQEIVSGGISLKDLINTTFNFNNESLGFKADAQSGPGGSTVSQIVTAEKSAIDTSALKDFQLNFDPKGLMVY